jgi:chromosome segregation ATPase
MSEGTIQVLGLLIGILLMAIRNEVNLRRLKQENEEKRKADKSDLEKKAEEQDLSARAYFQQQVQVLDAKLQHANDEIDKLRTKTAELTIDNAKKEGTIATLQEKVAVLRTELETLRAELKSYQEENGQLISENSKLSHDIVTLKQQKERAEKLNREYLQQITKLLTEIEGLKQHLSDMDMRLRHNEGTIAGQAELILQLQTRDGKSSSDTQKITGGTLDELNIEDAEATANVSVIIDNDNNEDIEDKAS